MTKTKRSEIDRRIDNGEAGGMSRRQEAELRAQLEQLFSALGYAGNTDERAAEIRKSIAETQKKLSAL